jgi:hypothetical protein
MSMKNCNDTIGNRTRNLPACSAVPQPTALTRAPTYTIRTANPSKDKRFFSSPKLPYRLWGPRSLLFIKHRGSFPGVNGRGVKLTIHLHRVPKIRMSGAIHLLPIYAIMAWKEEKTLLWTLPVALMTKIKHWKQEFENVIVHWKILCVWFLCVNN